jgi:phosphotransferase system  glucose/maltose/N-acetylglucosamine-specific IIC component
LSVKKLVFIIKSGKHAGRILAIIRNSPLPFFPGFGKEGGMRGHFAGALFAAFSLIQKEDPKFDSIYPSKLRLSINKFIGLLPIELVISMMISRCSSPATPGPP